MTQALGIDVSKWQTATPPLTGLDFLFARASIGTQTDPLYATHIANARNAGLLVGAYHFGDYDTTSAAQVKAFLAAAGDVDFYVLDHEGARQMTDTGAKAFIKGVQDAGHKCGLYHSLSGFPDFGQDYNWIALWASTPPKTLPWKFWQYSGSPLDKDVFNGTPAELRAFAGKGTTEVTITITTLPFGGLYLVKAGTTPTGIKLDAAGAVVGTKKWVAVATDVAASYDATVTVTSIRGNPFVRCTDGFFAGHLVPASAVVETPYPAPAPAPDTSPFTQADIDRAVAADRAKAQVRVVYE